MNHEERDVATIAKPVQSVELVARTPVEVRAMIGTMEPDARAQLSANWLALRLVTAHTLPDNVASQRVLTKCGFQHTGDVVDPEDGLVWRFEKHR